MELSVFPEKNVIEENRFLMKKKAEKRNLVFWRLECSVSDDHFSGLLGISGCVVDKWVQFA
jgi:DNA-binding transcriptional regulator YiaG